MQNKLNKYYQNSALRHHQRVVAFAILGLVLGAYVSSLLFVEKPAQYLIEDTSSSTPNVIEVAAVTEPVRLLIPEVGIDTPFGDPLGVNDDRTIEVPDSYDEIGYYKYAPLPGEIGPAVVLGHVDSYEGPAVFYNLRQLEEGDEIYVVHEDGATSTFAVTKLETHRQSGFPTASVYSDLDYAGLRLITCTGIYDHGEQVYSHNLIVFAKLKDS